MHLSQVHQPRNIEVILAWMVHLRQVHPLKKALRNRNKKAAGHAVMSSGYTLIYKLLQYCLVGALETSAPPKSNSCSVGALLALASGKAERRQVHPLKAPPKVTSRSSCHQPRRCPCRASMHRCRGSVRRCCRRGCLRSCWLR